MMKESRDEGIEMISHPAVPHDIFVNLHQLVMTLHEMPGIEVVQAKAHFMNIQEDRLPIPEWSVAYDIDSGEEGARSQSSIKMLVDQDQDDCHWLRVERIDSQHKNRMILQTSEEPLGGPEEFAQRLMQSVAHQTPTTEMEDPSFYYSVAFPDTEYGKSILVELLTEKLLRQHSETDFRKSVLIDLINERRIQQHKPPLRS